MSDMQERVHVFIGQTAARIMSSAACPDDLYDIVKNVCHTGNNPYAKLTSVNSEGYCVWEYGTGMTMTCGRLYEN